MAFVLLHFHPIQKIHNQLLCQLAQDLVSQLLSDRYLPFPPEFLLFRRYPDVFILGYHLRELNPNHCNLRESHLQDYAFGSWNADLHHWCQDALARSSQSLTLFIPYFLRIHDLEAMCDREATASIHFEAQEYFNGGHFRSNCSMETRMNQEWNLTFCHSLLACYCCYMMSLFEHVFIQQFHCQMELLQIQANWRGHFDLDFACHF